MIQRLRLGAKAGGTLDAVTHEAIGMTSQHEEFARDDASWSGALYKSPSSLLSQQLVRLDLPTPADMRAPGGATGVYGLECAMDELAAKLGLDPLPVYIPPFESEERDPALVARFPLALISQRPACHVFCRTDAFRERRIAGI